MGEKKDGGEKKEGGPITVVLKVDMHCEGCAKKVRKSVEGFDGVESVKSDSSNNNMLIAVGKVDPEKLKATVESKTKKKVELVSPQPKKDKVAGAGAGDGGDKKKGDEKKAEEKKPKQTTVILKIRSHCVGCIQKTRKIIRRIDGVEQVTIDAQKDLVTVKGTMDTKEMAAYLKEKLKRSVEIVPPKKEEKKEGEKKEKEGVGGGGKKEKEKAKGGGEKESGDGCGEKGEKKEGVGKAEAHKMEYYPGPGYAVEYVHAPQIFSDENPNACSVM